MDSFAPNEGRAIDSLVAELSKLPGVGAKTARRFAFHIINAPTEYAKTLASAIVAVRERIRLCESCCSLTEQSLCRYCASSHRDSHLICVVERPSDVDAIEGTGEYNGLFHVLHGVISPLDGIGPDDIELALLMRRLQSTDVSEIIVATNPSVNGEATAAYIHRLVEPLGIRVSRIGTGVPIGADIEFADKVTLGRAITGRRPL